MSNLVEIQKYVSEIQMENLQGDPILCELLQVGSELPSAEEQVQLLFTAASRETELAVKLYLALLSSEVLKASLGEMDLFTALMCGISLFRNPRSTRVYLSAKTKPDWKIDFSGKNASLVIFREGR